MIIYILIIALITYSASFYMSVLILGYIYLYL